MGLPTVVELGEGERRRQWSGSRGRAAGSQGAARGVEEGKMRGIGLAGWGNLGEEAWDGLVAQLWPVLGPCLSSHVPELRYQI